MGNTNQSNDLKAVKNRLVEGKLSEDDIKIIEGLLTQAEEAVEVKEASSEDIGGRKIIAHLPHGMDIVK